MFVDKVGIDEQSQNKTLIKVTDVLVKNQKEQKKTPIYTSMMMGQ